MNVDTHQQATHLFQTLSHLARLRVLDELRRDEACVCHLQAVLGRPQAYISQQLRVLRDADVVADRKDGQLVYYRLIDPQITQLLEIVLGPAGERTQLPDCPCPRCTKDDSKASCGQI